MSQRSWPKIASSLAMPKMSVSELVGPGYTVDKLDLIQEKVERVCYLTGEVREVL